MGNEQLGPFFVASFIDYHPRVLGAEAIDPLVLWSCQARAKLVRRLVHEELRCQYRIMQHD
ncbi:hypothetical protein M413DRAFT_444208 [Hebeloma cylindrosporum]|uniref:Uncharacterized protein n=1 Tax=Hebeloma cylindrosporum TaxID=76867 RepID=A0A0C3C3A1_HEBCY|nr:hypothetical protein M413DRAFT_444208 [Hebeloma cylindrosporum h7]